MRTLLLLFVLFASLIIFLLNCDSKDEFSASLALKTFQTSEQKSAPEEKKEGKSQSKDISSRIIVRNNKKYYKLNWNAPFKKAIKKTRVIVFNTFDDLHPYGGLAFIEVDLAKVREVVRNISIIDEIEVDEEGGIAFDAIDGWGDFEIIFYDSKGKRLAHMEWYFYDNLLDWFDGDEWGGCCANLTPASSRFLKDWIKSHGIKPPPKQ